MNTWEVKETTIEAMKAYLEEMDEIDLVTIWNEYIEDSCGDERLYTMEDLDDIMCGCSFMEGLEKIDLNNFDPCDSYIYDSIYGIRSTDDPTWDVIEIQYIIDHVIYENGEFAYYYPELQQLGELFQRCEADEETEEETEEAEVMAI